MFSTNSSIIARPTAIGYAPIVAVTSLTGGGVNALDGLDVSALDNGYVLGVCIGDSLQYWKIRAIGVGEVEDGTTSVVPDADPTRIWVCLHDKHGNSALTIGAKDHPIVFATALTAEPSCVEVTLIVPNGGALMTVGVTGLTAAGFTAKTGAPIPAAGYKIHWRALL